MTARLSLILALLSAWSCSDRAEPSASPEPTATAPAEPAKEPAEPAEPAPPPPPALEEPANPDEACGQILVVSYKGAKFAEASISRDKAAAAARAAELLKKVKDGADFAELAKSESDAPSSAPRGGIMGAFHKAQWPELHAPLKEPLFGLKVYELAEQPVETDYGYVLLRRCKVERARSRHILIRYQGASRAGPEIERTKEQALARAQELRKRLSDGADFADLAKEASDDASAASGGDLGSQARGRLALAYEQALFSLEPGHISQPIESEFGYHIIQRMPD